MSHLATCYQGRQQLLQLWSQHWILFCKSYKQVLTHQRVPCGWTNYLNCRKEGMIISVMLMHFHMTRLPRLISSCFNSNRSCMATDLNDDNCMFWFQWSTDVQMALLGVTLKMDTATPPTMARTMSVTVTMATPCSLWMVWMATPSPALKMAWHRVMSTTWTTPVSVSVTESYNYDTWITLVSISLTCSIYYMDNTESISVNIVTYLYICNICYILLLHMGMSLE